MAVTNKGSQVFCPECYADCVWAQASPNAWWWVCTKCDFLSKPVWDLSYRRNSAMWQSG